MKNLTALGLLTVLLAGCGTTTSETYSRDPMEEIGNYPPPPAGLTKARAAVMEFQDKTDSRWDRYERPVGSQASEQLETLVMRSSRFSLVERQQLENVLREQNLQGVVDPVELAKPGRIRGVDYVFLGAITNFRVKMIKTKTAGGIFDAIIPAIAPLDIDTSKTVVETQVGVDIKLVNTNTGEIVAKDFGEVKREDVASAWGLRILGIGGDAKNELRVDADSQGKILRWALDESYKKMIPPIDEKFSRPQPSYCGKCKVELPTGQKFCTKCGSSVAKPKCKCGAELEYGARFCGSCGAKLEGVQPLPDKPAPAPAPAPQSAPPPPPAKDYMPKHLVLARLQDSPMLAPAILDKKGEGDQPSQFVDARTNQKFEGKECFKTRPAGPADLKPGAQVFVINLMAAQTEGRYEEPGVALRAWGKMMIFWEESRVTEVVDAARGLFKAAVFMQQRTIHVSNARVLK